MRNGTAETPERRGRIGPGGGAGARIGGGVAVPARYRGEGGAAPRPPPAPRDRRAPPAAPTWPANARAKAPPPLLLLARPRPPRDAIGRGARSSATRPRRPRRLKGAATSTAALARGTAGPGVCTAARSGRRCRPRYRSYSRHVKRRDGLPQVTMEPTASQVFCGRVLGMVNAEDVNAIILAQKNMLDRFEKTNEMLLNFNNLSSVRMQQMNERFLHHTRTLVEMKKDLDSIFRRIRTLKGKLAKQYPEAFSNIHESPILEDDDDFDPVPKSTTTTIATSEQSTESCDTSPDVISPTTSQDFEDLSQGQYDGPAMNGQSLTDEDTANGLD
ncbi:PREDICTED: kxDL motif-containing protein 1 [Sturnus vulgaris]|nr:PREDICTED: kxDL motif-containing protein 1 [Sturnus vulgaris]